MVNQLLHDSANHTPSNMSISWSNIGVCSLISDCDGIVKLSLVCRTQGSSLEFSKHYRRFTQKMEETWRRSCPIWKKDDASSVFRRLRRHTRTAVDIQRRRF
ncbi:hypothetical protein BLNAU_11316 [Blattamonas nauphoetae]|uniref:Uncharacterized protein n=1 Tax=Blattamonas nauphoetae TaxID=2049346 RepID=A0ABQ9XQF9_9EUKA|nr:hypothetical protein BLNAU_11316 [Blattamonas nauphoetae]